MENNKDFFFLLQSYLKWLYEKNLSENTILAYSQTFHQLIAFAAGISKKKWNKVLLNELDSELITKFLAHLTENRKVSPKTRNMRLSAIKSFFNYVLLKNHKMNYFTKQIFDITKQKGNTR